jgi:uroporphyrin-III C-methyltransferase/precorrin-2 dehydrogenase/sirohydrochlorin ferrochelatase
MQEHQRYFPVRNDSGKLMPHFVTVANIESRDVAGRSLVFAATGVEVVDAGVVTAARAAGTLANSADDLERCDFHVPAVARRGDIVIAVGTAGAAPGLAARLRDRFAASLGPEWERFAALLAQMRSIARRTVADRAERMRVMGRASRDDSLLAALARGAAIDAEAALTKARFLDSGAMDEDRRPRGSEALRERAFVSLVGAGPGAPDLLTVRAVACIREADVIVYDDLVDRRVLEEASPRAELVYYGKRCEDSGPPRQGPEVLVERALEGPGKRVVRLKGGDPNVFGRSAEEIAALENAGVHYEIVPGVTAALAAAAAAAIPLTQRGVARSVTFVSGTSAGPASGSARFDDIARLVATGNTVAAYMGLHVLPEIIRGLAEEGLRSDTPVAVVSAASLPEQSSIVGTLADIAERVSEAMPPSPAIVLLGEVARARRTTHSHVPVGDTELLPRGAR